MSKHVNDFVLRRPLLWLFRVPTVYLSAVDVSLLLPPQSGTACQKQSVLQHLWSVQKVIEDGTVHVILYANLNN